MTIESFNDSLFSFIASSPTAFHAVLTMKKVLDQHGFEELDESEIWDSNRSGRFYVSRNGSLIAFILAEREDVSAGFRVVGCHSDSPCLQLKPHVRTSEKHYFTARIETYGGALLHSWFDRGLSVAGRVVGVSQTGTVHSKLVDFQRPIATIPSVALHLNREANKGQELNVHNELCPIFGQVDESRPLSLDDLLIDRIKADSPAITLTRILGFDLFCYDAEPPCLFGVNNEFIASPRLDNLLSCFVALQALCQAGTSTNCMLVCTNHEEIGSTSSSGALSNFADSVFSRLAANGQDKARCQHRSFFVSLDNAHATHPNYPTKSDDDHEVLLNRGPAIKINAGQRYATNARSAALFRLMCREAGIATQDFVMRGDMTSGSTIGPLSSATLGVETIDVGAPTWGMHAIREVTGSTDPYMLYQAVLHFLSRSALPGIEEHD